MLNQKVNRVLSKYFSRKNLANLEIQSSNICIESYVEWVKIILREIQSGENDKQQRKQKKIKNKVG